MELPDSPASSPLGDAASAADPAPDAPINLNASPDNAGTLAQPSLPDSTAPPLPPSRPVLRAPQPPDSAALDNARRGIWAMNENHDGWVLLGADRKPVMRQDRSRVSFRFRDAARLAQELAASSDDLSPGASAKGDIHPVPLAPLDSGYNRDWDPQAQKSFLADITKACRLLAYQYVQFTEPQEAVRRAVSDILQNPTYVKEPQMNAWVPGKFDAEAVKLVASTLHKRVIGPEPTKEESGTEERAMGTIAGSGIAIVGDVRRGAMLRARDGLGTKLVKDGAASDQADAKIGFNNQQIDNHFDREKWDWVVNLDERKNTASFITTSNTIAVKASSVAFPPTNQFGFKVTVTPLNEDGSPQVSLATKRWFEPVHYSSGSTGTFLTGQRVIRANAPEAKKFKWTIVISQGESTHGNTVANSNMLEVFKPR